MKNGPLTDFSFKRKTPFSSLNELLMSETAKKKTEFQQSLKCFKKNLDLLRKNISWVFFRQLRCMNLRLRQPLGMPHRHQMR